MTSDSKLEIYEPSTGDLMNKKYALITMCIGVGQGYATVIEKV